MSAQNENRQLGMFAPQFAQGLYAVFSRHRDVEQDHIPALFTGKFESFIAVVGFANEFHVGALGKDLLQASAKDWMIVGDKNSHRQASRALSDRNPHRHTSAALGQAGKFYVAAKGGGSLADAEKPEGVRGVNCRFVDPFAIVAHR